MSFKYEAITDEVSKKVDCQNKYKDITRVTPLEYSEAFPIKLSGDGHCVLTERFVKFYLASVSNFLSVSRQSPGTNFSLKE